MGTKRKKVVKRKALRSPATTSSTTSPANKNASRQGCFSGRVPVRRVAGCPRPRAHRHYYPRPHPRPPHPLHPRHFHHLWRYRERPGRQGSHHWRLCQGSSVGLSVEQQGRGGVRVRPVLLQLPPPPLSRQTTVLCDIICS